MPTKITITNEGPDSVTITGHTRYSQPSGSIHSIHSGKSITFNLHPDYNLRVIETAALASTSDVSADAATFNTVPE